MSHSTAWSMLKDALAHYLDGWRVTHGVFTTYCFDPEFFETAVVPQLLPELEGELSLHTGVRRLQLEQALRHTPVELDVYFDGNVIVPGTPWLPYRMQPVRGQGAFHGKVILLRLVNEYGHVRWMLGAGSANLTRAGWWENLEAWYFAPPFDPQTPPAGLAEGLRSLLDFLVEQQQDGSRTASRFLQGELSGLPARMADPAEPRFGVFLPRANNSHRQRVTDWLSQSLVNRAPANAALEIISPYFPDSHHPKLVQRWLDATGCERLHLWLPLDPWQAGGAVVRMRPYDYQELSSAPSLAWCDFQESALRDSRNKDKPAGKVPRFLHAKVFRIPGLAVFIGSVNFSNAAIDVNFETGFLLPDDGEPWLTPRSPNSTSLRFDPAPDEASQHDTGKTDLPALEACYHWGERRFALWMSKRDMKTFGPISIKLFDVAGRDLGIDMLVSDTPVVRELEQDHSLGESLRRHTWLTAQWQTAPMSAPVWVHQEGLEFRPLPTDLQPDIWRILDFWRSTGGGQAGSNPEIERLEVMLSRAMSAEAQGDALPEADAPDDIFSDMAMVHGSFHSLQRSLQHQKAQEKGREGQTRRRYYFSASRPDTLVSLLDRLADTQSPPEKSLPDDVDQWIMLHWVKQLCLDNDDLPEAQQVGARAKHLLQALYQRELYRELEQNTPGWCEWMGKAFLGSLDETALDSVQIVEECRE